MAGKKIVTLNRILVALVISAGAAMGMSLPTSARQQADRKSLVSVRG